MLRRFLRVALASVALTLAISGAMNSNRVAAQDKEGGLCGYCGCNGGTVQCCSQGNIVCYLHG